MIKNIPLNCIDPNPFQVRSSEDPEHVKNLALSIAEVGLLQIPTGRLVGGKTPDGEEDLRGNSVEMLLNGGHRVQLAFGHSRLAAFRFLLDTGNMNFAEMPVNIQELTDEQIFSSAVAENLDRKDISVMDEARAMTVYRDHFKKTSAEIGGLFHLSDSAVRNKIRLLQLPEEIQAALNESKVSEGAGRALLELFDLPEEIRQAGETQWDGDYKPTVIVRMALTGTRTADQVHNSIENLVRRYATEMGKCSWKYDEVFEGPDLVGACKGCQYLVRREKQNLCLKSRCYYAKEKIMERRYLEKASLACGIPILEGDSKTSVTTFQYSSKESALSIARAAHCPNLRLAYDKPYRDDHSDHLQEIGFPNAQILCGKQEQWCSCYQAVKAGLASKILEKVAPVEKVAASDDGLMTGEEYGEKVAGDNHRSEAISADDLKDIAREIRQKKKENLEENKGIQEEATKAIAHGLLNITNPRIWLMILDRLDYASANKFEAESKGDFSDDPVNWCDEIRTAIGKAIVQQKLVSNYYYSEPDPDQMFAKANELLKKCGLHELETVSAETEVVH